MRKPNFRHPALDVLTLVVSLVLYLLQLPALRDLATRNLSSVKLNISTECVYLVKLLGAIGPVFFVVVVVEISNCLRNRGYSIRVNTLASITWIFKAIQVMKIKKKHHHSLKNTQPMHTCDIPTAETWCYLITHRKNPSCSWSVRTQKLRTGFTGTQILWRWPSEIW